MAEESKENEDQQFSDASDGDQLPTDLTNGKSILFTAAQFQQLMQRVSSPYYGSPPRTTGTSGGSIYNTSYTSLPRSSAIKPSSEWDDVSTDQGRKKFAAAVERDSSVKPLPLTVKHKDHYTTTFHAHSVAHSYHHYLHAPTLDSTATGRPKNGVSKSAAGTESVEIDFGTTAHILDKPHDVNARGVLSLGYWMYGPWDFDMSNWTNEAPNPLPAMEIHELNLNLDPNDTQFDVQRVVSDLKHRYRIVSQLVFYWLQNLIHPDSWKSLMVDKASFLWEDKKTKQKFYEGFWLLNKVMTIISPAVVIDNQALLETLNTLSLPKAKYNVTTLISQLQENQQKIVAQGGVCSKDTFLHAYFRAMKTGNNVAFNKVVEDMETKFHMDSNDVDIAVLNGQLQRLYNTFVKKGTWGKTDDTSNTQIALTTLQKKYEEQEKKIKFLESGKKSGTGASSAAGGAEKKGPWRTNFVGDTTKHPDTGEDMVWCRFHGKKGCYMPKGHNHDAWAKARKEKDDRRAKRKTDDDAGGSSPKSLKLNDKHASALCTALTTKLSTAFAVSDEQAEELIKSGIEVANKSLN